MKDVFTYSSIIHFFIIWPHLNFDGSYTSSSKRKSLFLPFFSLSLLSTLVSNLWNLFTFDQTKGSHIKSKSSLIYWQLQPFIDLSNEFYMLQKLNTMTSNSKVVAWYIFKCISLVSECLNLIFLMLHFHPIYLTFILFLFFSLVFHCFSVSPFRTICHLLSHHLQLMTQFERCLSPLSISFFNFNFMSRTGTRLTMPT